MKNYFEKKYILIHADGSAVDDTGGSAGVFLRLKKYGKFRYLFLDMNF